MAIGRLSKGTFILKVALFNEGDNLAYFPAVKLVVFPNVREAITSLLNLI